MTAVCGVVLVIGGGADRYTFAHMMHAIAARGEVPETLLRDGLLAGTHLGERLGALPGGEREMGVRLRVGEQGGQSGHPRLAGAGAPSGRDGQLAVDAPD